MCLLWHTHCRQKNWLWRRDGKMGAKCGSSFVRKEKEEFEKVFSKDKLIQYGYLFDRRTYTHIQKKRVLQFSVCDLLSFFLFKRHHSAPFFLCLLNYWANTLSVCVLARKRLWVAVVKEDRLAQLLQQRSYRTSQQKWMCISWRIIQALPVGLHTPKTIFFPFLWPVVKWDSILGSLLHRRYPREHHFIGTHTETV